MTLPGCFVWNWSAGPLCRGAACGSHSQLSYVGFGILGCPSLVMARCPSCVILRRLLLFFHPFLSFVRAWSGGGRILRLLVGFSRMVVFLVIEAIQISSIVFHPFWTLCLRNGSARSLHFDWQAACWVNGNRELPFDIFLSSSSGYFNRLGATFSSVRLFPQELLKSFLDCQPYCSVAGSQKNVQLFCHAGGSKSFRFLDGPLKMGCWVQQKTENFNVVLHPLGILSWSSHLNSVETFGKPLWLSCQDVLASFCG